VFVAALMAMMMMMMFSSRVDDDAARFHFWMIKKLSTRKLFFAVYRKFGELCFESKREKERERERERERSVSEVDFGVTSSSSLCRVPWSNKTDDDDLKKKAFFSFLFGFSFQHNLESFPDE